MLQESEIRSYIPSRCVTTNMLGGPRSFWAFSASSLTLFASAVASRAQVAVKSLSHKLSCDARATHHKKKVKIQHGTTPGDNVSDITIRIRIQIKRKFRLWTRHRGHASRAVSTAGTQGCKGMQARTEASHLAIGQSLPREAESWKHFFSNAFAGKKTK